MRDMFYEEFEALGNEECFEHPTFPGIYGKKASNGLVFQDRNFELAVLLCPTRGNYV